MIKTREMSGGVDRETEVERLGEMVDVNKIRLNLRKNRLKCPQWESKLEQNSHKVGRGWNAVKSKCLEGRNAAWFYNMKG